MLMKFTTALAALAFLGIVAAKPLPSTSARALSKRGPSSPPRITWAGDPEITWANEPDHLNKVPHLKELWGGAACKAVGRLGCAKGTILSGPIQGEGRESKTLGRHIIVQTDTGQNLKVFSNGSVANPESPYRGPTVAWADGSKHEKLSPSSKEAWQTRICNLDEKMRCAAMTVTRGPHYGKNLINVARHGKHVNVKTSTHENWKVYADGTGRMEDP